MTGGKYFLWSGWPGKRNGQQNLYIAPMRDPGDDFRLARADCHAGPALGAGGDADLRRAAGAQAQRRYVHRLFRQRKLDPGLLPGPAAQQRPTKC